MTEIDVAVIGGGVTGLASALFLAERGASVCLLESAAKVGRATSTHNSGVIHAGIYYPAGSLKARLCVEGRDRLYEFCATHKVPHARCGKLIVAADDHEVQELDRLLASAEGNGVRVTAVGRDFIKEKEPNVGGVAQRSIFVVDDFVSPSAFAVSVAAVSDFFSLLLQPAPQISATSTQLDRSSMLSTITQYSS